MEPESPEAAWPLRIAACGKALHDGSRPAPREAVRAELWVLLHAALMRYLRARARGGFPSREDLEDIASTKAIELLASCESGVWAPAQRTAGEIAGYVATVARNGFVDFSRRNRLVGRVVPSDGEAGDHGDFGERMPPSSEPPPHASVESRELARGLVECAQQLPVRSRRVWFMRAFYEMTSRDIATHPAVRLDAAYVDVVAKRARDAIRACLQGKGLEVDDTPPGAFVELWTALESLSDGNPGEAGEEA